VASRKDEKEQRKQERLAAEAEAAGAARKKKLTALVGGTVLAAILVVVVLVVVSQSDSGDPGGDPSSLNTDLPVLTSLDALEQKGSVAGDPSSKVTIREFGDLQCPACKQFSETVIPELVGDSGVVGSGDAALEFQNFVIIGKESVDAAKASLAAGEQDRMWQFVEIFYANQGPENSGYVTDEFLTEVAEAAGVEDMDAWNESRADPKWDAVLSQTQSDAQKAGFTGTPSVLVDGPEGQKVLGSFPSTQQIEAAVQSVE